MNVLPLPALARRLAVLAFFSGCMSIPARAIVRRDDVADESYISLGSPANFPASGFITAKNGVPLGGTLIDPLYVLTAAHIQGDIVPGVTTFTIGGAPYVIAEQRPHSAFNATGKFDNDINVVRLAMPVLNVTPASYYTGVAELNSTATTIGYGETGTGLTGSAVGTAGQRRGAQNTVDAFGDGAVFPTTSFMADFDRPGFPLESTIGSFIPLPLEGTVALFDSGGGIYANFGGGPVLIGINSFTASRDGTPNNDYGDLFGATRVSLFSGYIAANIPEPTAFVLALFGAVVARAAGRPRIR